VTAPTVLVTRAAPEGAPLAARLAAAGWRTLDFPLIGTVPTGAAPDLSGAQAALLTSAAAARAVAGRLGPSPPPALCVGAATARAARAAGFEARTAEGAGDGAALADWAAARLDPAAGPLAFLRGADVAGDLAGALRARGFAVRETVVYEARPATAAPPEAAAALAAGAVDAVPFYSPRAAAAFATLAAPWRLSGAVAAAISAAAAAPVRAAGFGAVVVAARPDGPAVEAALAAVLPAAAARAAARGAAS
jgi:uroporphyrinogen-III synthase